MTYNRDITILLFKYWIALSSDIQYQIIINKAIVWLEKASTGVTVFGGTKVKAVIELNAFQKGRVVGTL